MHTGACGNARTKLIDCICQSLIKANATSNQTVLQDTTGEYMDQESTIVMNLCPPAHMQAFHFVISLMGFCFHFMDHTIGIGLCSLGTVLNGTAFQCL